MADQDAHPCWVCSKRTVHLLSIAMATKSSKTTHSLGIKEPTFSTWSSQPTLDFRLEKTRSHSIRVISRSRKTHWLLCWNGMRSSQSTSTTVCSFLERATAEFTFPIFPGRFTSIISRQKFLTISKEMERRHWLTFRASWLEMVSQTGTSTQIQAFRQHLEVSIWFPISGWKNSNKTIARLTFKEIQPVMTPSTVLIYSFRCIIRFHKVFWILTTFTEWFQTRNRTQKECPKRNCLKDQVFVWPRLILG